MALDEIAKPADKPSRRGRSTHRQLHRSVRGRHRHRRRGDRHRPSGRRSGPMRNSSQRQRTDPGGGRRLHRRPLPTRSSARQRGKQLERDQHALELSRREAEVHRENTEERSLEELGIELTEAYDPYAEAPGIGRVSIRIDREEAEAQVAELRERRSRRSGQCEPRCDRRGIEPRGTQRGPRHAGRGHRRRNPAADPADRRTGRQLPRAIRPNLPRHPRELRRQLGDVQAALPRRQRRHHADSGRGWKHRCPGIRHRDHGQAPRKEAPHPEPACPAANRP